MQIGGLKGGQYQILSQKEIKRIHNASLQILKRTGIKSRRQEVLQIFSQGGAEVDFEQGRVRIPSSLVEDAINKAPSEIILCGRDEKNDLVLEDKKVYFGTGGAALKVLDLETGKVRKPLLKDIANIARLSGCPG